MNACIMTYLKQQDLQIEVRRDGKNKQRTFYSLQIVEKEMHHNFFFGFCDIVGDFYWHLRVIHLNSSSFGQFFL